MLICIMILVSPTLFPMSLKIRKKIYVVIVILIEGIVTIIVFHAVNNILTIPYNVLVFSPLLFFFSIIPSDSWSASTSPARSPSPARHQRNRNRKLQHPSYESTSLSQRSRSPSPVQQHEFKDRSRLTDDMQHSYPMLVSKRQRRCLPLTPSKPASLLLKRPDINFPELSDSPTRVSSSRISSSSPKTEANNVRTHKRWNFCSPIDCSHTLVRQYRLISWNVTRMHHRQNSMACEMWSSFGGQSFGEQLFDHQSIRTVTVSVSDSNQFNKLNVNLF